MPRRVDLPGADELFTPTAKKQKEAVAKPGEPVAESGRVKHNEKMTVYLTSDELLALEQARLRLRAQLGRTVDRGRFVRAALAESLADLAQNGTDSAVARRLSES